MPATIMIVLTNRIRIMRLQRLDHIVLSVFRMILDQAKELLNRRIRRNLQCEALPDDGAISDITERKDSDLPTRIFHPPYSSLPSTVRGSKEWTWRWHVNRAGGHSQSNRVFIGFSSVLFGTVSVCRLAEKALAELTE